MSWRGSQEMPLDDSPEGPRLNRKDTKRWCKGVVGREHDWQVVDYWTLCGWVATMLRAGRAQRSAWLIEWCTVCQKQGKHLGDLALD